MRVIHDLVQGSPEWDLFRLEHDGASEAAAMLGLSKKVMRSELLHAKHTGIAKEFSDWFRANILDRGHEVEALARPHVEALIGQDLYPVTCSDGKLSASCDGLTMDDVIAMEHKQWNEDLAALVGAGIVPDEHMPQCQQVLMVTGAEKLIFVVSDGTPGKMVYVWVLPDPVWFARIRAGWVQFDADLAAYVPPEVVERVTAAPIEALPAVSVRMDGALAVVSNLDVFGAKLREFVAKIPAKPTSDQEFADADAAVKALKKAEEALDGAEANALGQVQSVETLTRTIGDLRTIARTARLATEKLVTARKTQIRTEEVQRGKTALAEFIAGLNTTIGKPYMPPVAADFAGAISGKKTMDSLRNAIDTELARAKIAANEIAGTIVINLRWLREHAKDHTALFPDTGTIVLKAPEDLQALAQNRINEHRESEQKKADELRERIRAEEAAKLQREQQEKEALERRQREEDEARQRREREAEEALARQTAQAAARQEGEPAEPRRQDDWAAPAQPPAAAPIAQPAVSSPAVAANSPNMVPIGTRAPAAEKPTLTLGEINARLGITMTSAFVRQLGIAGTPGERSIVRYRESEFGLIGEALVAHVRTVLAKGNVQAA